MTYQQFKAELEHRCDQRDAALESVGLLTKENAALKAEVERLTTNLAKDAAIWKKWLNEAKARAEKAEAELDAARPLLEAAMGVKWWIHKDGETTMLDLNTQEDLLQAALAYREKKGA